MLEPQALKLLATLPPDGTTKIDPLDFTSLLQLRDRGYVTVSVVSGRTVAERTRVGRNAQLRRLESIA
jgi:hypothetical protein